MDLSVVIASFQNPQGLYLTTFAVIEQLSKTTLTWEVILSCDGGDPSKWEKLPNVKCLRIRSGSPQGTRDVGIRAAQAQTVLVLEDHVVVSDIAVLYEAHKAAGGDISVPYRIGETGELFTSYGYEMDWDRSFWNKTTQYHPKTQNPYAVLGFGHACFMISRDFYVQSGGYFLEMQGWGGEEPDLTLLSWHCGRGSWMIPTVWHAHNLVAGAHANAVISDSFKRNFCIAAYEHGGDLYLQKAESYYNYRLQKNDSIEERRQFICRGNFSGDLNRLRRFDYSR